MVSFSASQSGLGTHILQPQNSWQHILGQLPSKDPPHDSLLGTRALGKEIFCRHWDLAFQVGDHYPGVSDDFSIQPLEQAPPADKKTTASFAKSCKGSNLCWHWPHLLAPVETFLNGNVIGSPNDSDLGPPKLFPFHNQLLRCHTPPAHGLTESMASQELVKSCGRCSGHVSMIALHKHHPCLIQNGKFFQSLPKKIKIKRAMAIFGGLTWVTYASVHKCRKIILNTQSTSFREMKSVFATPEVSHVKPRLCVPYDFPICFLSMAYNSAGFVQILKLQFSHPSAQVLKLYQHDHFTLDTRLKSDPK